MTIEEMQAQLDKMKDDIAHMEAKVSECEHMISVIKAQDEEPKFERAKKLEHYKEVAKKVCDILNKECENNG